MNIDISFCFFYSGEYVEHEVLGLANIFHNLVNTPSVMVVKMLIKESQLFPAFLQMITKLACKFGKEASNEEEVSRI